MSIIQAVLVAKLQRFLESEGHLEFTESIALSIDFAAVAAARKEKRKRNCTAKSISCGYSCQPKTSKSGKKTQCGSTLDPQAATYADWMSKRVTETRGKGFAKSSPKNKAKTEQKQTPAANAEQLKPTAATTQPEAQPLKSKPLTHKDYIATGQSATGKLKKLMDDIDTEFKGKITNIRTEVKNISPQFEQVKQKLRTQATRDPKDLKMLQDLSEKGKSLLAQESDLKKQYNDRRLKLMNQYRDALLRASTITDEQAKALADKIEIPEGQKDRDKIRQSAIEYFKLTNGKGSTIKKIHETGPRAHANPKTREINIGNTPNTRVLFHEGSHIMEIEDPNLIKVANDWMRSKATGTPEKMSKLTGNPNYRDNEVAFPDKFITPYVGKYYGKDPSGKDQAPTEVLSVGVEHFADAQSMLNLFSKDPEHFNLMVGILKRKK